MALRHQPEKPAVTIVAAVEREHPAHAKQYTVPPQAPATQHT